MMDWKSLFKSIFFIAGAVLVPIFLIPCLVFIGEMMPYSHTIFGVERNIFIFLELVFFPMAIKAGYEFFKAKSEYDKKYK